MVEENGNPELHEAGNLLAALVRDWDFLVSEIEGHGDDEVQAMLGLVTSAAALERAARVFADQANTARVEGRFLSAEALERAAETITDAVRSRRRTELRMAQYPSPALIGDAEAERSDVVWSAQAHDDSVLVLVKRVVEDGEYLVSWFTEYEWQRADFTARMWTFEFDHARPSQFGIFHDEQAAVEAAKAALDEQCGRNGWS